MSTTKACLLCLSALLLAACGPATPTIGEVTQSATAFEGREVTLRGTTASLLKLPLAETKGYRLKDATGEIVVWTTGTMPGEGEEVVVRGRVENLAIIAGQSYGLSLQEIERRPPGIRWPWQ